MRIRILLLGFLGIALLGLVGFGVWLATLPGEATAAPPPVPPSETAAAVEALRPVRRSRPVVAVIGINDATETTDYLMPAGILRRSDVADVVLLATGPGPVKLYPALTVRPDATVEAFDATHPGGADYVLVPAMSRDDDPAVMSWLRRQATKGAMIIGVCAGAKVVAEAGLLDGKRATTHWYYLDDMVDGHPSIRHVADRRFVVDGRVATTTGITASMPMAVTLIEAIAGREKAAKVAQDVGLTHWDARHASGSFALTRPFVLTVLRNSIPFWRSEEIGVPLEPGVDEVSLALVADAWSRTYRSEARTMSATPEAKRTLGGVQIIPDTVGRMEHEVSVHADKPPAKVLDQTLADIGRRYGPPTARLVAGQLEYPLQPVPSPR
jgi:putative intracellular protease/amidase